MISVELLRLNGRTIARVFLPRHLVRVFGAILASCILCAPYPKAKKRRGSGHLLQQCISGVAGEIASCVCFRRNQLDAQMFMPEPHADRGYDLIIEERFTIQVKTSSFSDGRGSESIRSGDRFAITPHSAGSAHFHVWCVTQPQFFQSQQEVVYIDIFAVVSLKDVLKCNQKRPFSTPAGIRVAQIEAGWNIGWLLELFKQLGVTSQQVSLTDELSHTDVASVQKVLASDWVRHNLLGSRRPQIEDRIVEQAAAILTNLVGSAS